MTELVRALLDPSLTVELDTPVDRALVGGARADRVGYAFACGYAEALRALVPSLTGVAALCVTERGGNHPRAIDTRLVDGELTGRKTWATGADAAARLLVVASVGERDGRNALRVVNVAANASGVTVRAGTPTTFVPEIAHAEIELDRVRVANDDVLPGDGYDDYVKPFRTVEDAHVYAALAGYWIGVARRRGWRESVERATALALALRAVALADPKSPATHVALAGALELATHVIASLEAAWAAAPDDEWQRWLRDRPIMNVAGRARAARRDRAWQTLG
jgi:alkylation response protein AidB-like acyl-CoA dehydrogenase